MKTAAMTIHFAPLLPDTVLIALGVLAGLLLLLSAAIYKRGLFWRSLCALGFLLTIMNPSLIVEQREQVPDVLAVVVDRSPSQNFGKRKERADQALAYLQDQLKSRVNLDLRVIEAPNSDSALVNETRLFEALDRALADVPPKQRAGVVFITDGQIHDIPHDLELAKDYGPVHGLLTGDENEKDRQLVIIEAPAYGIVGQTVTIRYRIEDTKNTGAKNARLLIRQNNKKAQPDLVPVGEDQTLQITIEHAGQNIVDLEAAALDGEITLANNRAPLIINGVRDRLKVLLVSGQPHAGGRTWRNFLTSDPGVDLVHFTILREPDKLDATPQNELSLIAFPFRELFEIKLYDFDLIIFDRYRLNRILPNYYFANIARYVREGGALLEASGPSFAGPDSIYTTALQDVLPAMPTGKVIEASYKPWVTTIGKRHPVTQSLFWHGLTQNDPGWGSWLRQVSVRTSNGDVLMTGADNQPLLILDRVGEGRVAQLASDQIWLWSRGYEGGGPQAELLKRLAHWLMKEPELEENALDISANGEKLVIKRRSLSDSEVNVIVTRPDGEKLNVQLTPGKNGWLEAEIEANALGIYTVDDGVNIRSAIIGELNPPELRSVISTADPLNPLTDAVKGSVRWLADDAHPDVRFLPPGRNYAGTNWVGLRENRSYNVIGVKDRPLLPEWVYALLLIALLLSTWWFEGRQPKGM